MRDQWNLMKNWDLILPPSRPSNIQLNAVKSVACDIEKDLDVAVLGSTPEYRDLLFEMGFKKIYVFDRNKKFYLQNSINRIYNNDEKFVYGDWMVTLNDFYGYFALILSDLTSGNIPYNLRRRFYANIENSLIDGGIFFDKVLTHNNNFKDISTLLEKYEELPINLLYANYFSCEFIFCSELLKKELIVDTSSFYETLKESTMNKRIHKFIELSKLLTPLDFVWYYGKNWDDLKVDYCPNLQPINIMEDSPDSPYFGFTKIFSLKKNK